MPSSKSASAKLVGSWTPFSFEQASHRFTLCILPSRICVRKTVASLHLQTSHNMFVSPSSAANIQRDTHSQDIVSLGGPCYLIENRRASLVCHFAEPCDDARC